MRGKLELMSQRMMKIKICQEGQILWWMNKMAKVLQMDQDKVQMIKQMREKHLEMGLSKESEKKVMN